MILWLDRRLALCCLVVSSFIGISTQASTTLPQENETTGGTDYISTARAMQDQPPESVTDSTQSENISSHPVASTDGQGTSVTDSVSPESTVQDVETSSIKTQKWEMTSTDFIVTKDETEVTDGVTTTSQSVTSSTEDVTTSAVPLTRGPTYFTTYTDNLSNDTETVTIDDVTRYTDADNVTGAANQTTDSTITGSMTSFEPDDATEPSTETTELGISTSMTESTPTTTSEERQPQTEPTTRSPVLRTTTEEKTSTPDNGDTRGPATAKVHSILLALLAVLLFILVCLGVAYLIYVKFYAGPVVRVALDKSVDPEEASARPASRKRKLPSLTSIRNRSRRFTRPPPVPLENFLDRVEILHRDSDFFFASEYELIKNHSPAHPQTVAMLKENRPKNRYANILPFDHSRVKLLPMDEDEQGSDYINANYIPGYNSKREFIATQGPNPATIYDFWRMVWEQTVTMIVMVTNLEEHTKVKCNRYWPADAEPIFYGDILVQLRSETALDCYVIRSFDVKVGNKERSIKQMHFVKWPDFGCPEKTDDLLDFIKAVRFNLDLSSNAPIVVHCSAGVGRTGTFIALDTLQHHILTHDTVDIFGLTLEMREYRPNMVQAESQYIFIHDCLRDVLKAKQARKNAIEKDSDSVKVTDDEREALCSKENGSAITEL